MTERFSITELADRVNAWCASDHVIPANGQAADEVSERNLRYYRTLGILDAPEAGANGYTEKHFLQLVALRLLQAQGLPLRRIRELLHARSLEELREIQTRGLAEARSSNRPFAALARLPEEVWRMIPINEDYVLVSRRGAAITSHQRSAIARLLSAQ
jgi:DNA-binding transcriptional MerR regulator